MKYFRSGFLSNDHARIPFSVIGVFLIIGSSFTTIYVTQLEQENSLEISSTLDFNQVDYLIRYVEADLARSLNYAGCKAFQKIGKNPVIECIEDTEYYFDSNNNSNINYIDVNLNAARHMTMSSLNNYIKTNFMNNRYTVDGYTINVVEKIVDWKDIDVRIIEMNLERSLNRPVDAPRSTYKVYPVMSTTLFLEVKKVDESGVLLTKKVSVSTIINSRYPLLEDITGDFDDRLSGTLSALGVDVLAGAMGLTWIRGYSQFFLNTPSNIISNDWLEILTNGGILLEESFVFNSADPIGMVYVGYKTADTIANELGYDLGGKLAALKKSVSSPVDSTGFNDVYKENFNDMLPNSEMSDTVNADLDDISTEYTLECDSDNLCEEELNNLLKDETIPDAIKNLYNAVIQILINRRESADNLADILRNLDIEKTNSKTSEESRSSDAEQNVDLPDGWVVKSVNLVGSKFYDENEDIGTWDLKEYNLIGDTGFFDNSDPNLVVLDGEKWNIIKQRSICYNWNVETTWEIHAENETDSDVFIVVLNSNMYQHDAVQNRVEDVTINFVSDDYSNGNVDLGNNNIKQPFETINFYGSETRSDPNLDGALTIYQNVDHIAWSASFRTKIFTDENGKYVDGSYNDGMLIESKTDDNLHMDWLDVEVMYALENMQTKISTNVTATSIVGEGTLPDELVDNVTDKLIVAYHACKPDWLNEIKNKCCEGNIYRSTASKVIYYLTRLYIENVGERLQSEHDESSSNVEDATDDAIDETDNDVNKGYKDIKNDMKQAEMLGDVTIPMGATLTLRHPGDRYSSWEESVSFAIKQNPPFFCQEYYECSPFGDKSFDNYLKYRNVNIFSPIAGATGLIEDGFEALNDQILGTIDTGFEELNNIQDATIRSELESDLESLTNSISDAVTDSLSSAIYEEQGYYLNDRGLLSENKIQDIVTGVIDGYGDNPSAFIHDLNGTNIQNEIINQLKNEIKANILDKYGADAEDIIQSATEAVTHQVINAYDKGVSKAIGTVEDKVKTTYEKFSKKLEKNLEKKMTTLLSKFIPSGLPILPPFGWWCTINVWYIEVEGEIPEFKVVDSRNEVLVNPLMGHDAQEYFRQRAEVYLDFDGDGINDTKIGDNTPISFGYNTGTFIIVPPGKTGVGDRTGGMDECYEYPK